MSLVPGRAVILDLFAPKNKVFSCADLQRNLFVQEALSAALSVVHIIHVRIHVQLERTMRVVCIVVLWIIHINCERKSFFTVQHELRWRLGLVVAMDLRNG